MKRFFDIVVSSSILIAFFPFMFIIAIFVWFFLGWPIIFTQMRPGKNCKPFRLLKFRSMTNEKDKNGFLLPNEKRHTRFGKLLRSTSLDELPSLFNVLKGEMSIVGPRPLKFDYIPLYKGDQIRRHEVSPGITGLAQVNGRNAISFTDRFKMDVWYVSNQSFLLDIKIIMSTIFKVIKRKNIEPEDNLEIKPFDGTN